jgi:hypothetical protein
MAGELEFSLSATPPEPPDDTRTIGYLRLTNSGTGQMVLEVPIDRGS